MQPLEVDGAWVFTPRIHPDHRGSFHEWFSDQATVLYLCSAPYLPGSEHGVHPLDPAIGIEWPAGAEPILSDKDAAAPTLEQARASGLLPDYGSCAAHAAGLRGPGVP